MMVQDKSPFRPNILDTLPDRGRYHYNKTIFSSGRRKDYNNINLPWTTGLSSQNQNNSIKLQKKTLERSVSTQVTFGGFLTPKNLRPKPVQIHSNIINKSLKILGEVNSEQHQICQKFIKDFTSAVKMNDNFRTKLGFSDIQTKTMSDFNKNPNLWHLPEKSLPEKTVKSVFSPFVAVYKKGREVIFDNDFGKKNFGSVYKNIQTEKEQNKIVVNYKNVVGIFNSIEKWENSYRKRFGFENIKAGEKFMMPDEELQRYLKKRTFDSIDPKKGRYDVKHLSAGNRIFSGIIGSVLYGFDAFNTTMKFSNDKQKSEKEGKIKFAQQMIRVGLASYFGATALGIFKKQTNKSIGFAILVSGVTVLASEVLGRLAVGKPILPTSKHKIEEMKEKSKNSNNLIIKFGRFLSGESSKTSKNKPLNEIEKIKLSDSYVRQRYQTKFFGSEKRSNIHFQGIPKKYKKEELKTILKLVHEIDADLAKYYKNNILKNMVKKKIIKKEDMQKGFDKIMEQNNIVEIEIGKHDTTGKKIKKAVFAPFIFIKNVAVKAFNAVKKFFSKEKISKYNENLNKIKKEGFQEDYNTELAKFKTSQAFLKKSKLNEKQKIEAFTESFLYIKDKGFNDEMQGIQNSFEWLKKNIKMDKKDKTDSNEIIKNILANKDKADVKRHLEQINKTMNKMSFTAYAKDFADYDTTKFALLNNVQARGLSSIFLVFDAINLTMEHSNNKKKAIDNGTQYATQEATKTLMSSYIINSTTSIFQGLHNASLAGAFLLTAFSASIIGSVSRLAVGNPILPKTQKELLAVEEKNKNNPMLKITSRMVGKSMKKIDFGAKQTS